MERGGNLSSAKPRSFDGFKGEKWVMHMDVFKLAFETIIVGLLAFLWLGIALYLLSPTLFRKISTAIFERNPTLIGVGLLSIAYCIGSAILPISNQLLNDEHWPLTEDSIRCEVFKEQQDRLSEAQPHDLLGFYKLTANFKADDLKVNCISWSSPQNPLSAWWRPDPEQTAMTRKIATLFDLQETKILSQESDKTDRFRQLMERVVVLRGAVFSGFVLLLICVFAYFAPLSEQTVKWPWRVVGLSLCGIFMLVAVCNGLEDLHKFTIFDIPILEAILFLVAVFGIYLSVYGVQTHAFRSPLFLFALGFFAVLVYGGWLWSEVIYDQQVINSFAVLEAPVKPTGGGQAIAHTAAAVGEPVVYEKSAQLLR
jgi:hypothetical protein